MQTQQQKQVQRREQEALGAESCSGVGVTVKVMGEGGGGQWACHSSYQEGETSSDGKKIKKESNPLLPWGVAFQTFSVAAHRCTWACMSFFLDKDSVPGTPTILKSGWLVLLDL